MRPVTLAAEYLALTLPGNPERVASLLGMTVQDVARVRRLADLGGIDARRRLLDTYTTGEPPVGSVHESPARGDVRVHCCGLAIWDLPADDRMTREDEHVTCGRITRKRTTRAA